MMELVREPVAEYLDFHVARTIVYSAFPKRTAEDPGGKLETSSASRQPKFAHSLSEILTLNVLSQPIFRA